MFHVKHLVSSEIQLAKLSGMRLANHTRIFSLEIMPE